MTSFFAMNGYAFYVWSAYAFAAVALAVELFALRSRRRAVLAEAQLAATDTAPAPGPAE